MYSNSESLSINSEDIPGDNIDHVNRDVNKVSIYFKDGRYIRFSPILDLGKHGIKPVLDLEKGFWGRVKE